MLSPMQCESLAKLDIVDLIEGFYNHERTIGSGLPDGHIGCGVYSQSCADDIS